MAASTSTLDCNERHKVVVVRRCPPLPLRKTVWRESGTKTHSVRKEREREILVFWLDRKACRSGRLACLSGKPLRDRHTTSIIDEQRLRRGEERRGGERQGQSEKALTHLYGGSFPAACGSREPVATPLRAAAAVAASSKSGSGSLSRPGGALAVGVRSSPQVESPAPALGSGRCFGLGWIWRRGARKR